MRDSFSLQETPPPRKRLLVIDSSPRQRPLARDSFSSQETPHKRLHASDSSQETPHERLLARDSLQETSCKRLWRETPCFLQGVSCKESLARYYDKGWDKKLEPATIRTPKHAAPKLPHKIMARDGTRTWGQRLLGRPNMPRLHYHTTINKQMQTARV